MRFQHDFEPVTAFDPIDKIIALVLKFDYDQDPEAVELQTFIKEHGIDEAITKFTGAEKNSKLFELIKSAM